MAEDYPMECAHLPEVRIITQSSLFEKLLLNIKNLCEP
jgi:hypothetical protein